MVHKQCDMKINGAWHLLISILLNIIMMFNNYY